jgi:hypothetical protein
MKTSEDFLNESETQLVFSGVVDAEVTDVRIAMCNHARHIIDEVLKLYVPDGNPIVWKEKILELRKSVQ